MDGVKCLMEQQPFWILNTTALGDAIYLKGVMPAFKVLSNATNNKGSLCTHSPKKHVYVRTPWNELRRVYDY